MARPLLLLLLLLLLCGATEGQYAYHSASPHRPWVPITVATPVEGVALPAGDIWYGPHCQGAIANSSAVNPLSCGGNKPSPYFIDREAAAATGFAPGTVVLATTWTANQSYDSEPRSPDRASPNFILGLASLGLARDRYFRNFRDFLYIERDLGLWFLVRALSRPQVSPPAPAAPSPSGSAQTGAPPAISTRK
jgi:hypothetical protein